MSYNIAIAGKGGVGKTSTTGLIIDYLVKSGQKPILAVDADANSNLNEVLGVEAEITIGEIREEVNHLEESGNPRPGGMTKVEYLEYRLNQAIMEGKDYDLLVMGRTQGQGCYCYVNGILKTRIDKLKDNYKYIIVDNEAGMEHISRGTIGHMDMLLLVSDCSRRGIEAVGRIRRLVDELKLKVSVIKLIVTKAPEEELHEGIKEEIENQKLDLIGVIPQDKNIYEFDSYGKPLVDMPEDSPSKLAVKEIVKKLELI